ncbi:MAG TPA: ABC transporter permease [Gemmataceae bacterium]|nr:ABC transporter permease [Gemmataceae bacterium]
MFFTLAILWYERRRFLPAVLAVAFSALLAALQCGLLLGTFATVSIPVDYSDADLWIGCPDVVSVDLGRPVPLSWRSRLCLPEIVQSEEYVQAFAYWRKPSGAAQLVLVIGSRLHDRALGRVQALDGILAQRLQEPGAVVVDDADLGRLEIPGTGARTEVNGQAVKVVGLVRGLKGLPGPYLFCSLETARAILGMRPDQATFLVARCRPATDAAAAAEKLRRRYPLDMDVLTREQFSLRSRCHWLVQTGGGIALSCAALLGLMVGAVVTSQTLYAATLASLREYAVLRALGTPRWRIAATIQLQAFCVGIAGIMMALPVVLLLTEAAELLGAHVLLPGWLLAGAGAITLVIALFSGLWAQRSLRLVEPAALLR